jgi:hypothetical protein
MYMIVAGMDRAKFAGGKTVFNLWYLFGSGNILDKWRKGINLKECIDRKTNNAHFSSKEECAKVITLYGLLLEDFDGPVAFCRKKNYPHYPIFWKQMCDYLYLNRIWIHRGSDLECHL